MQPEHQSLLAYQPDHQQTRVQIPTPKTIQQLKNTTVKHMKNEFDLPKSAKIANKFFNLNNNKINRYINNFACTCAKLSQCFLTVSLLFLIIQFCSNNLFFIHTCSQTMQPEHLSLLTYQPYHQQIRAQFLTPKTIQQLKSTTGEQMENEFDLLNSAYIADKFFNLNNNKMNRYIDIFAYEHSRIKLESIPNYYINANEVRSLVDNQVFAVFSQAPIKKFDNFWEAAYFKNISVVVMLCSFYDPKRGQQSEQYWPDSGKQLEFSSVKIKVKNINSDNSDKEYVVTNFLMSGPQGDKKLTHIHWMGWSDLRKPAQGNMNRFEQVLDTLLNQIENKRLVWIHCSAGIGRTGSLGGVLQAIRLYKKYNKISIFQIVQNMRRYRYHAVQTFQQYKFLYQYLSKKLV